MPKDNAIELAGERIEVREPARPSIRLRAGELSDAATRAEQGIVAAGLPIFRRGPALVRPVVERVEAAHGQWTNVAQLAHVDTTYLRDILDRTIRFEKYDGRRHSWVACNPPLDIAATILGRWGEWTFRPVAGVLTTPTLKPDGTILSDPGYDPLTRLLLMAPPVMPPIPAQPTRDDALAALALLNSLLKEFPFADEPSRAVALSALITPVVRAAFPVTPMHVARAPTAGSGKSYLFDISAAIATGQPCPVMAAGRKEEETEKRLGAALLAGQPIINIDNLNGDLGGDALCQMIERPIVEVRILGRSERVRVEARGVTFFATGNNLNLVGDMTRRAIVASLDSRLERPELRKFTGTPVAEVLADRGRFIAAALTICRAYILDGRPDPVATLASFERWSHTVPSALVWLGCEDPTTTMETARAEDPDLAAYRGFLHAWIASLGIGVQHRRTLSSVLKSIDETRYMSFGEPEFVYATLRDAIFAIPSKRGGPDARELGYWARRFKGRIVDGLRLMQEVDSHGHAAKWWVDCA